MFAWKLKVSSFFFRNLLLSFLCLAFALRARAINRPKCKCKRVGAQPLPRKITFIRLGDASGQLHDFVYSRTRNSLRGERGEKREARLHFPVSREERPSTAHHLDASTHAIRMRLSIIIISCNQITERLPVTHKTAEFFFIPIHLLRGRRRAKLRPTIDSS